MPPSLVTSNRALPRALDVELPFVLVVAYAVVRRAEYRKVYGVRLHLRQYVKAIRVDYRIDLIARRRRGQYKRRDVGFCGCGRRHGSHLRTGKALAQSILQFSGDTCRWHEPCADFLTQEPPARASKDRVAWTRCAALKGRKGEADPNHRNKHDQTALMETQKRHGFRHCGVAAWREMSAGQRPFREGGSQQVGVY